MTDILNPVVEVHGIQGGTVGVRELKWKSYMRAIKSLTEAVIKYIEASEGGKKLDPRGLVEAIAAQEGLASWVVAESTGRPEEWVAELTGREMMAILEAVVELNLSEEVVGRGKALAARMRAVFASTRP